VQFRLRDYRPGDLETLWRIDQECFEAGIAYSVEEMRFYLRQPGAFALVAEPVGGGDAAGFIVGQAAAARRAVTPLGYIITIDVLAGARRSGLGSQLLAAAEEHMRRAGCWRVVLEAAVDNAAALAFYKRHGYAVVATHPGYYSNGVDGHEMEKAL
jgi:[ribosomal protein S18]-alanine N-acetyltransferase